MVSLAPRYGHQTESISQCIYQTYSLLKVRFIFRITFNQAYEKISTINILDEKYT